MIASTVLAQESKMKLLGDFQEGWEKSWIERKFYGPPATFEVVEEDADSVLQVTTNRSGSALWHSLNIKPTERSKISWRWKIEDTLPDNTPERKKIGDDYVARVYLVFAPHLVNWRTRAICYVWVQGVAHPQKDGHNHQNLKQLGASCASQVTTPFQVEGSRSTNPKLS